MGLAREGGCWVNQAMRPGKVGVAALFLLVAIAPAAGAEWTDPEADHEVGYTVGAQWDESSYAWTDGEQTGWYPYIDLVEVGIDEPADDTIRFLVETASSDPEGSEPQEMQYLLYDVYFVWNGANRSVRFYDYLEDDRAMAVLRTQEGELWRHDFAVDAEPLQEAAGWTAEFPKFEFRDADLVPLRAGHVLEGVHVKSSTNLFSGYSPCVNRPPPPECWKGRDALGSWSQPLGDYEVVRSPPNVGHLALTSETPLRSSNGLATTYIFEVVLHNLGPEPDRALMRLGPVPSDWQVNLPLVVELEGESRRPIPVAVTVPFTHLHGKEHYVNITAESEREPGVTATQTIGVVWTAVPQPAGHHSVLYVHAADMYGGWMNTLPEDPEAVPEARLSSNSYSVGFGFDSATYAFGYSMDLSPPLQIGLDFDTSRPVKATLVFDFPEDVDPAIDAHLYVANQTGLVASIGQATITPGPVTSGAGQAFDLQIPVNAEADRIPYAYESNLLLEVSVNFTIESAPTDFLPTSERPNPMPLLVPGQTQLEMPLVEFVEVPDEALLSSLTRFSITAKTATEKRVNPGGLVAFGFEVANADDRAEAIEWRLLGSNAEWAQVHPGVTSVPRRGNATVAVTVEPPEHAAEGEHALLLLLGQSRDDANAQVFIQLAAQVTTSEDIPDEQELADELRKEAGRQEAGAIPVPAFLVFLAVGAALAAVALRRREE